jgi:pimeloyl-ACP methyl ester carboxylesterase
VIGFVILKVYSMVQAYRKSHKVGSSYTLKKFNRSYVYILTTVAFLVLTVFLSIGVARSALMDMSDHHPFRSAKAKELYLRSYEENAKGWPVPSETRMVDTAYGQTFVRISGPGDSPPLVLLPGAGGASLLWIPNIEALSEAYRVYAVDNIYDFGRSVFTRKVKTPDDFVDWLDELFTNLQLGNDINLMGLSYGGWLTSQYALHHPERLDKAVLVAPASTVVPLSSEWAFRSLLLLIPHRHFAKKMMQWLMADLVNNHKNGQQLSEAVVDNAFIGLQCFKPKMLVNPTVLTDEELRSIKVPTLFLVGKNEKIYSPQAAVERLRRVAPQIQVEMIPDAGHDLTVVQADMINRKVCEFLNSRDN